MKRNSFLVAAGGAAMALLLASPVASMAQPAVQPAAAAPIASKDLSKIPSGVYKLDPNHASFIFKISHLGFSMYTGRFDDLGAELHFNAAEPEKSSIDFVVSTGSVDTHNPKLEGELREKFLKTGEFHTAMFHSTHLTRQGADKGTLTGDLTLAGVTKPVVLQVTFYGAGIHPFYKKETLGFGATTTIKRSDFGIDAMLPMVGDDVQIAVEAEFNAADSQAAGGVAPATMVTK